MATNPMQRKSRNAFILGVIITLLIATIIVVLLYMKIQSQQEEIKNYIQTTSYVYVLNQDVVSGQVLTTDMFSQKAVPTSTIPVDSNILAQMSLISVCTTDGTSIMANVDENNSIYYYIGDASNVIYTKNSQTGDYEIATALMAGETAYYIDNNNYKSITISENTIIAKVNLSANTIVTSGMIARGDEKVTADVRQTEYNAFVLPVDLITGDYVDIRLMLPSGENYIVTSKKQVTVPIVSGSYLADTIQMNLNEDEILTLSCAIVESYQIDGAYLYATKYKEPGTQEKATITYVPNSDVINLINNDPNVVEKALLAINKELNTFRSGVDDAINKYGDEENIADGLDESTSSTLEARKQYLQGLGY